MTRTARFDTVCRNGRHCSRDVCLFKHPAGRFMDEAAAVLQERRGGAVSAHSSPPSPTRSPHPALLAPPSAPPSAASSPRSEHPPASRLSTWSTAPPSPLPACPSGAACRVALCVYAHPPQHGEGPFRLSEPGDAARALPPSPPRHSSSSASASAAAARLSSLSLAPPLAGYMERPVWAHSVGGSGGGGALSCGSAPTSRPSTASTTGPATPALSPPHLRFPPGFPSGASSPAVSAAAPSPGGQDAADRRLRAALEATADGAAIISAVEGGGATMGDLVALRGLSAEESDAELKLLQLASPAWRARVRAALRATA